MKRRRGRRRILLIGPLWNYRSRAFSRELREDDFVVAVDGGVDRADQAGVNIHFAIGDWDSLASRSLLKRVEHVSLVPEKNISDLGAALRFALAMSPESIEAWGFTGGRADQHLAMIYECSEAARKSGDSLHSLMSRGEDADYHFLSSGLPRWSGELGAGRVFSLFPIGGSAKLHLRGARYPLKKGRIRCDSRGLSNVSQAKRVWVKVETGNLVLIIPRPL